MSNGDSLYALTQEFAALKDAAEFTDPETGEVIEGDALAALLAGLKGDLTQKAGGCLMVAAELRHRAEAFKAEEERMAKRRRVLENAAERLRAYVTECMSAAGTRKLEAATFSVVLLEGKESVVVEDMEKVPEQFRKYEWKPDIAEAKAMLKGTGALPAGFAVKTGKPFVRIS